MSALNIRLIVEALEAHKAVVSGDPLADSFKRNHVDEQIALLQQSDNPLTLLHKEGGAWLGTLRNWIQCKAINGDSVTWGSQDMLQLPPKSVGDFEFLAAQIAAAARNEFRGLR